MGHDIFGINRKGEQIAYARFNMQNPDAIILYHLLHAEDYYAGVSGTGDIATFSLQQIEQALNDFSQLYIEKAASSDSDFLTWELKQIKDFIQNCYTTAQKEGSVRIYFG